MSSTIIHRGVAIANIENMTFGQRLPKFENGLIVTYPIRIILDVDIVTRYQPSQKKFRTIVRGRSLLTFSEPGHNKQRTRQKAECLFIMN